MCLETLLALVSILSPFRENEAIYSGAENAFVALVQEKDMYDRICIFRAYLDALLQGKWFAIMDRRACFGVVDTHEACDKGQFGPQVSCQS